MGNGPSFGEENRKEKATPKNSSEEYNAPLQEKEEIKNKKHSGDQSEKGDTIRKRGRGMIKKETKKNKLLYREKADRRFALRTKEKKEKNELGPKKRKGRGLLIISRGGGKGKKGERVVFRGKHSLQQGGGGGRGLKCSNLS